MSTIVAVEKDGHTAVAWNNASSVGERYCVNAIAPSNVQRVGDSLIGITGYSVYNNIIEHYFSSKKTVPFKDRTSIFEFFVKFWCDLRSDYHFVDDQCDSENKSPFADFDSEFLIANRNGIFRVKEIVSVSQFSPYCAIGSGSPQAEGASMALYDQDLTSSEIAKRAVQIAIAFDKDTGGDVEVDDISTAK